MKYCFGTVCWNGYLERYIDLFINNYITIFKGLINLGINYEDILEPRIIYNNDNLGDNTETAKMKLKIATGKKLILINDTHKYTNETVMYSTRNRLRYEFQKSYPENQKVFFYFPIDDLIRPVLVLELFKLGHATKPSACMFKFFVTEDTKKYTAGTRPIISYEDIHSGDWGGYCAYNILDEKDCPLYPQVAIPNVAFYAELYRAGYKEYASKEICVDHLRHMDSHHFKARNTEIIKQVNDFLRNQRLDLKERGYK